MQWPINNICFLRFLLIWPEGLFKSMCAFGRIGLTGRAGMRFNKKKQKICSLLNPPSDSKEAETETVGGWHGENYSWNARSSCGDQALSVCLCDMLIRIQKWELLLFKKCWILYSFPSIEFCTKHYGVGQVTNISEPQYPRWPWGSDSPSYSAYLSSLWEKDNEHREHP